MANITLSSASKRPFVSAVSAVAIAIVALLALAGCASWRTCAEKMAAAESWLGPTGADEADLAISGFWLVGRLGCMTRESVRATPPPPPK